MEINKKVLDTIEEHALEQAKSVGLCFSTNIEYEELLNYYGYKYKFDLMNYSKYSRDEWEWIKSLKVDVIYADINFIGDKDPSVFELFGALKPRGILALKCFTAFNASEVLSAFFAYTPADVNAIEIEGNYVLVYKGGTS